MIAPRVVSGPALDPKPFLVRVRVLVSAWEAKLGAGFGEAKCHNVYAQLLKEYPTARKRDLRYAIERVLQEL